MSVANKERFVKTGLKILIDNKGIDFPPSVVSYEGKNFFALGTSNKEDLIPVNFDTAELQRVITFGKIQQFIYTSEHGDLYDVCLYKNEAGQAFLYGIRTRQFPETKGAKTKKEEVAEG